MWAWPFRSNDLFPKVFCSMAESKLPSDLNKKLVGGGAKKAPTKNSLQHLSGCTCKGWWKAKNWLKYAVGVAQFAKTSKSKDVLAQIGLWVYFNVFMMVSRYLHYLVKVEYAWSNPYKKGSLVHTSNFTKSWTRGILSLLIPLSFIGIFQLEKKVYHLPIFQWFSKRTFSENASFSSSIYLALSSFIRGILRKNFSHNNVSIFNLREVYQCRSFLHILCRWCKVWNLDQLEFAGLLQFLPQLDLIYTYSWSVFSVFGKNAFSPTKLQTVMYGFRIEVK